MDRQVNKELIQARQMVNRLMQVCRQTITYLDGASVMDEHRLRRALNDAINESYRFMNS